MRHIPADGDAKSGFSSKLRMLAPALKQKNLPAFGVGPVLLSKHGRRPNFLNHPIGPLRLDLSGACSRAGSENTFILTDWMPRGKQGFAGRSLLSRPMPCQRPGREWALAVERRDAGIDADNTHFTCVSL